MATRLPQFTLRTVIGGTLVLGVLAVAAFLTLSPLHLSKATITRVTPQPSHGPDISATTAPTAATTQAPAVAGAATQALSPVKTNSAPTYAQKPAPTATPVPAQYVTLTVKNTGIFKVTYNAGMNACSILEQARAEGKISSVTFDYSYMTTLRSLMVKEINGYTGVGWLYSATDSAGHILPAPGCSLTPIEAGYSVTWKPA